MRKNMVLVSFMLATLVSLAQVQGNAELEHLTFKGIPIDGTLSAFVSNMEKNGFAKVRSEEGYALFVGEYAAHPNSMVAVETLKGEDVVSKIAVKFLPCDTWSSLLADYALLKKNLAESYGSPSDQVEKFRGGQPVDDIAKMEKVRSGNSEYYLTYETPSGSIQLSIEHDSKYRCFVQLAFYDKINGKDM